MLANYLEAAIVLLIMTGMGLLIWRGGAKNPVGTGGLDRKLVHIDGRVKMLGSEMDGLKSQVNDVETRIEEIEKESAKAADIRRLERQIEVMAKSLAAGREEGAAMRASHEHTRRQIDLLYQHIVEKGMRT